MLIIHANTDSLFYSHRINSVTDCTFLQVVFTPDVLLTYVNAKLLR